MAINKVAICNMALSNLGNSSLIEAIDEGSPESNLANLWYDIARQGALAGFDWNFARKRLALAEHSEAPPDEWVYRYQYPADCVKFRLLENPLGPQEDPVPYAVEVESTKAVRTILTDLGEATGIYTFDCVTTGLFSPHFALTFSYSLAHYMAFAITGKMSVKKDMLQIYMSLVSAAATTDAQEGAPRAERQGSSVAARA